MAEPAGHSGRLAVVGGSPGPVCGVRDHAAILTTALEERGLRCTTHWLEREPEGLRDTRGHISGWMSSLREELRVARPDAVLLHYSVFSFSYRGMPLFVRPLLGAVAEARAPLVSVLHEYAFPWGRDGLRGLAWAFAQRAALLALVRESAALALTTSPRAQWISSRRWLPSRPAVITPIFSNLPEPSPAAAPGGEPSVGLFGYAYGAENAALVLDAVREAGRGGAPPRLVLAGAPGGDSAVGEQWLAGAGERGLAEPEFSGLLPAQELSDLLASCTVLVNADPSGPSSRKTTLAAMLASGRPVVALDGPNTWRELIDAEAAIAVAPRPEALAAALGELLGEPERARELGERARRFARENVDPRHSAETLLELLGRLGDGRR